MQLVEESEPKARDQILSNGLKRKMKEEELERGKDLKLSTGGRPLTVNVGTPSNSAERKNHPRRFSAENALQLKADLDLSHQETNKVRNQ